MRRFVRNVLLFFAPPVILAAAWTAFVVVLDRVSYERALRMPKGRDVVVISDSQLCDALDPVIFGRLHNFCASGTWPDQTYLRFSDFIARNRGRCSVVLLDATPMQTGRDERLVPLAEAGSARVHALLHCYHVRETERPFGSLVTLWRDVMLIRKYNELRKSLLRRRPYVSSIAGGFNAVPTAGFVDHPEKAARDVAEKAQEFLSNSFRGEDDRQFTFLRREIEAARAAGIEPVVVTSPYSPAFLKALDGEKLALFERTLAELVRRAGVRHMNYLRTEFPPECWRDANHLNRRGATLFSQRFVADFEKR